MRSVVSRFIYIMVGVVVLGFFASEVEACTSSRDRVGETIVERGYFPSTGICYISVRQWWPKDLVYRSYMFGSDGMVMVFNSFGDGPSSTHTGASEFYFFPLRQVPTYEIEGDQLTVIQADGRRVLINTEYAEPEQMSDALIEVDPQVIPSNGGGLQIREHRGGLRLEMGFRLGMNPSFYMDRMSDLVDERGERCRVRNGTLFVKKGDESILRFPTESELRRHLARACPRLRF
jgi:hypothetical protein